MTSISGIERVEQATNISSEYSSFHQQEFYRKKKIKKQDIKNKPKYSKQNLIEIIENTNRQFVKKNVKMKLEIHKLNNRIVIRLIDEKSKEIIKEIASEEVFDEVVSNWGIVGNLIDMKG